MKILIILVICILNLLVYKCSPIDMHFKNNSITYIFNENKDYYTSLNIMSSNYTLSFTCTVSSPNRTCTSQTITENISKQFIGSVFQVCEKDLLLPSNECIYIPLPFQFYPYPILSSEFTPSTKGGVEYLKGIYLLFGANFQFGSNANKFVIKDINDSLNPSIIGNVSSKSFDPTNIAINYAGGCGTSTFIWYGSGKEYQFNHAKPVIDNVEVKGLALHITGNNFCTNTHINSIKVIIDGTSYSPDSINDHQLIIVNITKQQQMTFQEGKSNASITVYGAQSNTRLILTTFLAERTIKSAISNNGQIIEYTLYNINDVNQNLAANITINDGSDQVINGKLIQDNSVSTTKSKQTFSFNIPPGCGKKQITISIGNQTENDELVYQSPNIISCQITSNNQMVECNGNFSDFTSFYSNSGSNSVEIKISNTNIQNEINIYNSTLSFKLKDEYESSNLEMCGIAIKFIEIPPTISKQIDSSITFNQKGGNITINGNHFNQAIIENTYFQCENEIIKSKVSCQYASNSILICPYSLVGPKDVKCNLILNGKDTNQITTINYQVHTVLNVTNQITASKGGVITIIGDQFYDSIEQLKIGNYTCESPEYHNETMISCLMPPLNDVTQQTVYVKVVINGKSNGEYLLVYLEEQKSGGGNSGSSFNYDHLKWMIIVMIVGLVIVGWTIYRVVTEFRWSREKGHQRELDEEFDLGIKMQRKMYQDYKEREANMPPIVEPPPPVPLYQSYYFTPYVPPEKRDPSLPVPEDENNWRPPTSTASMPNHPPSNLEQMPTDPLCLSLPGERPLSDYVIANPHPLEPIGDSISIPQNRDPSSSSSSLDNTSPSPPLSTSPSENNL